MSMVDQSTCGSDACGVLRPADRWSKSTARCRCGSKLARAPGVQPDPGPPWRYTTGVPRGSPISSKYNVWPLPTSSSLIGSRARIDDAEAVALGIGHHHESGIGRVQVPVDNRCAEVDDAANLRRLIRGIARIQVQMNARMRLRWRATDIEGEVRSRTRRRHEDHEIILRSDLSLRHVVQGF